MRIFPLILILFLTIPLHSQTEVEDIKKNFRLNITKTDEKIKVDGKLDEEVWKSTDIATDFWQKLPYFKEGVDPKTEIKVTYDNNTLYMAAKCYQDEDIIITSLKRDEYWDNDGVAIVLDPLNTKSNAYLFGTSAVGVQWDALRSETSSGINSDWSNKWYAEVDMQEGYWTAEIAIPLRIIRYNSELSEWGINFIRNYLPDNEFHNWTPVPESFWPPDPQFAGTLVWDNPPPTIKGNYNLIPYVRGGISKEKDEDLKSDFGLGIDGRVSLSSTLNLDVTFNPDFSQIEVDELVTNLTRFDIFLPEKRTFFLENGDLFADFGYPGARPFFSRKIGLDSEGQSVPILYGLRLTGNATRDLRVGVMNIHSGSSENTSAQNQTAISLKRRLGRSSISALFTNRQAFDGTDAVGSDYGRNFSAEGLYNSNDGKLMSWLGVNLSFQPEIKGDNGFFNSGFAYNSETWEIVQNFVHFQDNYYADMGFVFRVNNYDAERDTTIRQGFNESFSSINYRIRPKGKTIRMHNFGIENILTYNPDWTFNERSTGLRYFMQFNNSAAFNIGINNTELDLLYPFTFTDEVPLPTQKYTYNTFSMGFSSNERKPFTFSGGFQTGGFYNGTLRRFSGDINYRAQPWGNFSIGYQWNDLDFPDPYGSSLITAILSKVEIGFSRNLLWTTLFQYVDQSDFLGINSRLQWRFAPMSDIFLVYIDNYDVLERMNGNQSIDSNNRAVLLKMSYWY